MSSFHLRRRDFLTTSLIGGGLLLSGMWALSRRGLPLSSKPGRERYLFCGMDPQTADSYEPHRTALSPSQPGFLYAVTPELGEISITSLPFFGHSVIVHPKNPNLVFTSTKWGDHAALADTDQGRLLAESRMPAGRRYFGHAVFRPEGTEILASAANDTDRKGYLAVLDSRSLKPLGEIQSGGFFPHDCKISADGKTMVVVNMMRARMAGHYHDRQIPLESSVSWIEVASGKILKTMDLHGDLDKTGLAHCALSEDGWLLVTGGKRASQRSAVTVISPEGMESPLRVPTELEGRLQSEALSCAMDEKNGTAAVTVPYKGIVFLWNFRTQEFLGSLDFQGPKGIVHRPEQGSFVVLNQGDTAFTVIRDGRPVADAAYDGIRLPEIRLGSHLTRLVL